MHHIRSRLRYKVSSFNTGSSLLCRNTFGLWSYLATFFSPRFVYFKTIKHNWQISYLFFTGDLVIFGPLFNVNWVYFYTLILKNRIECTFCYDYFVHMTGCLYVFYRVYVYLNICLYLALCMYISVPIYVFVYVYVSVVYVSACLFVFLCMSLPVSMHVMPISACLNVCFCLYLPVSLSVYMSISACLYVFLCMSLLVSMYVYVCLNVCLILSLHTSMYVYVCFYTCFFMYVMSLYMYIV